MLSSGSLIHYVTQGTSFAPVINSWVEANPKLEWRWIQWIQIICMGVYLPAIYLLMPETRGGVILRRKAIDLRRERGIAGGARFAAREEVGKAKLTERVKLSLIRPLRESCMGRGEPGLKLIFDMADLLVTEPVVTFFSIWIAVGWGVLYGEIQGIPYIFQLYYDFSTGQTGLVYLSLACVVWRLSLSDFAHPLCEQHRHHSGLCLQYLFPGEAVREDRGDSGRRSKTIRCHGCRSGVSGRLLHPCLDRWGSLHGRVAFEADMPHASAARSDITFIAPCIGLVIILFAIFAIYLAAFNCEVGPTLSHCCH